MVFFCQAEHVEVPSISVQLDNFSYNIEEEAIHKVVNLLRTQKYLGYRKCLKIERNSRRI